MFSATGEPAFLISNRFVAKGQSLPFPQYFSVVMHVHMHLHLSEATAMTATPSFLSFFPCAKEPPWGAPNKTAERCLAAFQPLSVTGQPPLATGQPPEYGGVDGRTVPVCFFLIRGLPWPQPHR